MCFFKKYLNIIACVFKLQYIKLFNQNSPLDTNYIL